MTVETAINAVIFAVIGDVQRREHLHRVAEMLACFGLCALRHLLKERQRRGRQQCAEVLRRENILAKRTQYVSRRIGIRVIGVHAGNDLVLHLGADVVHTRLVLHVIGLFSDIFCGDDLRFFVFHDKYLSVFAQSAHLIENCSAIFIKTRGVYLRFYTRKKICVPCNDVQIFLPDMSGLCRHILFRLKAWFQLRTLRQYRIIEQE